MFRKILMAVTIWGTGACGRADAIVGAWFRELPTEKQRSLVKGTQLIKAGVFSRRGTFAPRTLPKRGEADCQPREGWVTHRLSAGETLTADSGGKLGTQLARFAPLHCLTGIELDLEPLPSPPAWLGEFLAAVRAALPKEISLSLAVPPITFQPLSGLRWSQDDAAAVLAKIDALDLMLYDTGAKTVAAYAAVLGDSVRFAGRALKEGKRVRLGLPSYNDKTKLHVRSIERLAVVREVFEGWPKDLIATLCDTRTEWLVYAGWTISNAEAKELKQLVDWRQRGCQKSDVKPGSVQ